MKLNCTYTEQGRTRAQLHMLTAGMTLAEMMVGLIIFAFVSISVTATIIQMRKQSENTMCETIAHSMAEGLIAQVRREGYNNLSDTTSTSVELKFLGVSSANHAIIQTFDLDWAVDGSGAPDLTNYTQVGEVDALGVVKGVVLDVDFKSNITTGVVIEPRRYMKMKINLTRTVDTGNGFVVVVLRYMWGQPDRQLSATGDPQYFSMRELRTVVSAIDTY